MRDRVKDEPLVGKGLCSNCTNVRATRFENGRELVRCSFLSGPYNPPAIIKTKVTSCTGYTRNDYPYVMGYAAWTLQSVKDKEGNMSVKFVPPPNSEDPDDD